MKKKFLLIGCIIFYGMTSYAGPDWGAIQRARQEKTVEKQIQSEQASQRQQEEIRQKTALEKLEAACAKVAENVELTAACDEIMALHRELSES